MDESYRRSLLARVPQQPPFRFIDEIVEIGDDLVVGRYRFQEGSDFYRGHFPGDPVTPGVILIEAMAQAGVVALGLHLAEASTTPGGAGLRTMFSEADVEFTGPVKPGSTVTTTAHKLYFRLGKLKVHAEMRLDDGTLVCSGNLAGVGVCAAETAHAVQAPLSPARGVAKPRHSTTMAAVSRLASERNRRLDGMRFLRRRLLGVDLP